MNLSLSNVRVHMYRVVGDAWESYVSVRLSHASTSSLKTLYFSAMATPSSYCRFFADAPHSANRARRFLIVP